VPKSPTGIARRFGVQSHAASAGIEALVSVGGRRLRHIQKGAYAIDQQRRRFYGIRRQPKRGCKVVAPSSRKNAQLNVARQLDRVE